MTNTPHPYAYYLTLSLFFHEEWSEDKKPSISEGSGVVDEFTSNDNVATV